MNRQPYYEMCTGKWFADHDHIDDLSNDSLKAAYEFCVAPPHPNDYPKIREAIENEAIKLGVLKQGQMTMVLN